MPEHGKMTRAQRTAWAAAELEKHTRRLARNIGRLLAHLSGWPALAAISRRLENLTDELGEIKTQSDVVESDAVHMVELTAGGVQVEEFQEQAETTAYIAWARKTARLKPELFSAAIEELLRQPGGREALRAIRAAVEKLN